MEALIGFITLVLALLVIFGAMSGLVLAWWIVIWFFIGLIGQLGN